MSTGNSSRLSYDINTYKADVNKSTLPMDYYLSSYSSQNCDSCYPEVGQSYPAPITRTSESQIDIENTLSTRDRKADKKAMGTEQKDNFEEKVIKYQDSFLLRDCPAGVYTGNSLLTDPKINYRGLSTQHLVFSYVPIQGNTPNMSYRNPGNVSSRDLAIEEYKKIMNIKK